MTLGEVLDQRNSNGSPTGDRVEPGRTDLDSEMIQKVRSLAREHFPEGAIRGDKEGQLQVDHFRGLADIGFGRALLPAAVGGGGMSCEAITQCMAEMAYVDASTAVAYNMHIVLAQYLSVFPFESLQPVFADMVETGATVCGAAAAPTGEHDTRKTGVTYRLEGDCYVADGKQGFASGSDAATYCVLAGTLADADEPTFVLTLPKLSDPGIEVMGNWDAMGLRATASHDVRCAGLRVPVDQAIVLPVSALKELIANVPLEVIHRQYFSVCTIIGCWQGLCEAVLDFLVEFSRTRFGFSKANFFSEMPDRYRSEEPWVRDRMGQLAYLHESGKVLLHQFARQIDAPPTTLHDLNYAYARTLYHWKKTVDEFIIGAMRVGGAHSFVTSSPLGRMIRDLMGCAVMSWRTDDLPRNVAQGLFGEKIHIAGLAGT